METLMKRALDIAHLFDVPRGEMACEPYGTGNINDTFCLTVRPWTGAARRYIPVSYTHLTLPTKA